MKQDKAMLGILREEDTQLVQRNFEGFQSLANQAKELMRHKEFDAVSLYSEVAALYAFLHHGGLFTSFELEQLLLAIGKNVIRRSSHLNRKQSFLNKPVRILHVASSVQGIGGHSRMIWRWIQQDAERIYSLVLTQQPLDHVPQVLKDVVLESGGEIHGLEENTSFISRAKQLHKVALSADLVVLHVSPHDPIPVIAFANHEQCPPIILLNHADHGFWLGASITNVVADLREAGMRISQERRGFEAEQNALLPIILSPIHREISRKEAKQKLGFDEDSIILLSIARAAKYTANNEINFADRHLPLIEQYEKAILIVIGPGETEDWSEAVHKSQGRIKIFAEREDTAIFYQAADIYVDSFPIASNTSLLEAGSYGVPLVSFFPYSESFGLIGAGTPGLTDRLIFARSSEEYISVLSQLIENEEFRLTLGESTRHKIVETHTGSGWQKFLEELYSLASTANRQPQRSTHPDQIFLEELDVLCSKVFQHASGSAVTEPNAMIQNNVGFLPFNQRLRIWLGLIRTREVGPLGRISLLLPLWLNWRLKKLIFKG